MTVTLRELWDLRVPMTVTLRELWDLRVPKR